MSHLLVGSRGRGWSCRWRVEGGTDQQVWGWGVTGWPGWERILRGRGVHWFMGALGAQTVKSPPAMQQLQV